MEVDVVERMEVKVEVEVEVDKTMVTEPSTTGGTFYVDYIRAQRNAI